MNQRYSVDRLRTSFILEGGAPRQSALSSGAVQVVRSQFVRRLRFSSRVTRRLRSDGGRQYRSPRRTTRCDRHGAGSRCPPCDVVPRGNSAERFRFRSPSATIFLRTACCAFRCRVSLPTSTPPTGLSRRILTAGRPRLPRSRVMSISASHTPRAVWPVPFRLAGPSALTWSSFEIRGRCSQRLAAVSRRRRSTPCGPCRRPS